MQRRWLLPGLGIAALGAGAGLWAWQGRTPPERSVALSTSATMRHISQLLNDQQFSSPEGEPLDPNAWLGRPLVLNFWATWCPPCVKELPELDRFARERESLGWQVVGIALDQAQAVRGFLKKHPVSFAIAVVGLGGLDLVRGLGNLGGGLPYSVMLSASGQLMQRKAGPTNFAELSSWADAI